MGKDKDNGDEERRLHVQYHGMEIDNEIPMLNDEGLCEAVDSRIGAAFGIEK